CTIFTHFMYIPVILASFWWKRKGIVVAVFLAGFLIIGHKLISGDVGIDEDYLRGFSFILVSSVIAFLSERVARKEEMVRDSHAELDQIFQTAADGMRVVDKDFNILRMNETFLKLAGISRDKSAGRKCYEVFPGPHCRTPGCCLARILGGEEYVEDEVEKERPDGKSIPCIVTATPFRDSGGDVIGIVEDFKDITDRKRAEEEMIRNNEELHAAYEQLTSTEEELRQNYDELSKKEQVLCESERKYRDLIELLPQTVFELDEKGTITTVNPIALKSFGYTQEDFDKGMNAFQVIAPLDHDRVREDIQRVLSGESLGGAEYTAVRKDGSTFPVIIYTDAIIQDMRPVGIRGILVDITERKQAEEQLRQFAEELEQKVADRTAQLNTTLKEKEMLLKEIHHRVKNNLQIVASLLNLQSRHITDPATLAMFRESQNRVRAMALVHERLYRSEDISSIGLSDYVRFMGANLFKFYDVTPATVRLTVDISDIRVDINRAIPLGLLINELLSNSLKYAFPSGRKGAIAVTGKKDDHTICIIVQDDGAGIPEDFDWRNTESLGLRLVCSGGEQLDGTIELDRSAGTAFVIRIPVAQDVK
ncbi:MAG: PAS domain S-box protein, partial [Methanoregula sp.]|nr:PAS domain S-box protein [Methanoregula sp.]